jgi:glycosyltransferase involved in cell wall biosynthesis
MPAPERATRRRALFIAYTFPPVGGAGVQRTTKFIKYLPQFGWDASVLTVSNPSVPLRDASLCRDVPAATHVVHARTFEPSYAIKGVLANGHAASGAGKTGTRRRMLKAVARRALLSLLQPDPQVLWNVPAFRAAMRTLRDVRHDVIVASGPPFSSLLLGAAISRSAKLPLVLDYRDEWDVSHKYWENREAGRLTAAIQRCLERYALRRASLVIATSPQSAATLQALCRAARSGAGVTHIFNGFDPEDFASTTATAPRSDPHTLRLVYTGTLYRLMSPEPLVRAIEALASHAPDLASRIELVVAGRRAPEQQDALARLAGVCRLHLREYVSHEEAIALMRSADALCIVLSDLPGAGRVVPAKIFEYMASRKPILAIAPPGEVCDLLRSHTSAFTCTPTDSAALRDWLGDAVRGGIRPPDSSPIDTSPFDRRNQAQRLASWLEDVATQGSASHPLVTRLACSG